jgi:uroporphyrinogen decarboxylase
MKPFDKRMTDVSFLVERERKPDFNNFLKLLKGEKPDRPTLFELFLNDDLYQKLANEKFKEPKDKVNRFSIIIKAFAAAGYDYATVYGSEMVFETGKRKHENAKTISLNEGAVITDWESFKSYKWPDPDKYDYSHLQSLDSILPEGMKLMVMGPGGVLENVISLVGYERLCYMIIDEPDLAAAIFDEVGQRLVRYYELSAVYDTVGMLMSNDDWGFNSQTMLSVDDMRKYVFPWHKKITEAIHAAGKPALLHSCGNLSLVMDDIIDYMKFDAKHSYEDNILPVEEVYERWGSRIAILGGIDVDFICRSTPEEVYNRACAMLDRVGDRGGYALGSGNSIPYYVPVENYLAMISAAYE